MKSAIGKLEGDLEAVKLRGDTLQASLKEEQVMPSNADIFRRAGFTISQHNALVPRRLRTEVHGVWLQSRRYEADSSGSVRIRELEAIITQLQQKEEQTAAAHAVMLSAHEVSRCEWQRDSEATKQTAASSLQVNFSHALHVGCCKASMVTMHIDTIVAYAS